MIWIFFVAAALAAQPKASPTATGDENALFEGKAPFQKAEAGELYRKGLAEFRERKYADAASSFRKGKVAATGKAESDSFERLAREAKAGEDLEKIRTVAAGKGGEARALGEIGKALPKVKGLRFEEEYRKLEDELREIVYFVIEDFEPNTDEAPDAGTSAEPGSKDDGGTGAAGKKASGKSRRRARSAGRSPFSNLGGMGKVMAAAIESGEVQSGKGAPDKVFQGEASFRWTVGKDFRVKALEFDAGTLPKYRNVLFAVRGSAGKKATVQVALVHKNINAWEFALGRFRGFSTSIEVKGPAWKEYRLSIDKDFVAKDEPQKDQVVYIIFSAKNQANQDIYLDDIRLER